MEDPSELVEIVSEEGETLGVAGRADAHSDPGLLHRVVHVLVFNGKGELLLQKRSGNKDTAPGLWDVSVGGHLVPGETPQEAARREMAEELGIQWAEITFLYEHIFRNGRESEFVSSYECLYNGRVFHSEEEIDEVRFFTLPEINDLLGTGFFSEHFEHEIMLYQELIP